MENHRVEANFFELMQQGPMTASTYMGAMIKDIDEQFGEGFSKKNPLFLAEMCKVCAMDYAAGVQSKAIDTATTDICNALDSLLYK